MINPSIFGLRVSEKIKTLAFEAFINETFVKALPFRTETLSDTSKSALTKYTMAVIEGMGGYDVLTNALHTEKDPKKLQLLKDIDSICTEAANKAANRTVKEKEAAIKNGSFSMEELVADAGLSKEEMNDFMDKSKKIDCDQLAEMIKNKVLDVLKKEKESHERIEKINTELRDAATPPPSNPAPEATDGSLPTDDSEDGTTNMQEDHDEEINETIESYTSLILGSQNKNEHKSFFSAIQQAACEQIIVTEAVDSLNPNEISLRRLKNLTFENTLKIFPNYHETLDEALENISMIRSAAEQETYKENLDTIMEACMVDSVIVYSLFESLYTMNMIHPSVSDMKEAIENQTTILEKNEFDKKVINKKLDESLRDATAIAMASNDPERIEKAIDSFEKTKKIIEECKEECIPEKQMETLESTIQLLKGKYEKLAIANESSVESFYDRRRHEGNVAQMSRVKMLLAANPGAKSIVFTQYPGYDSIDVTIESAIRNQTTHVTLDGYKGSIDEFRRIIADSVLMESNIPDIYLYMADGSGKKLKIK